MYRSGSIYRQRHQILAYADDIGIVTRTKEEMKRVFKRIEMEAKSVGLRIIEEKTKFMQLKEDIIRKNTI